MDNTENLDKTNKQLRHLNRLKLMRQKNKKVLSINHSPDIISRGIIENLLMMGDPFVR